MTFEPPEEESGSKGHVCRSGWFKGHVWVNGALFEFIIVISRFVMASLSKSIIIIHEVLLLFYIQKLNQKTILITSKNYSNKKKILVSKLVPMSANVLGMRLHHITATSTRAVRLPLLSRPPATMSSPLCNTMHAQRDRGEGKSPTLLQLLVAGW